MESAATINLTNLIALGGPVMVGLVLLSGILLRLGQLSNRVSELDRRFDRQDEENREFRQEVRQQTREFREEVRREIREFREENRRNHQQLLQALAHHTHDPDTGFAVFRIPPGTENPAA